MGQLRELLGGSGGGEGLLVLAGDFNASPGTVEVVELTAWLQDSWVSGGGVGDGLTSHRR